MKAKDMEITELQKKVAEEKSKLKAQQALYESVRADRNQFSQQYVEVQDEISEMRKKFKIITHQIDQLKEEIQKKDEVGCPHRSHWFRYQDFCLVARLSSSSTSRLKV